MHYLALGLALCICAPLVSLAQKMPIHSADIEVESDGALVVHETLVFYENQDGVSAYVHKSVPSSGVFGANAIEVGSLEALWNGEEQDVVLHDGVMAQEITIGSQGEYMTPGRQEIELEYVIKGAWSHSSKESRIAWRGDFIDNYWGEGQFTASVHAPEAYPIAGAYCEENRGVSSHECSVDPRVEGAATAYFAHRAEEDGGRVTITTQFDTNVRKELQQARYNTIFVYVLLALGALGLFAAIYVVLRKVYASKR